MFDDLVGEIANRFNVWSKKENQAGNDRGKKLKLSLPKVLKKVSRMVEKSQLKDVLNKGDISGVKDIVRAIMIGRTMTEVNAVIEIIVDMHSQGKLEIVRVKDRFVEVANPLNRHCGI